MQQHFIKDNYRRTTRRGGWCVGCGFMLVNPNQPYNPNNYDDQVHYYYSSIESGSDNYFNYWHYACSKSQLARYDMIRYQASLCLFHPHSLRWGVSANLGHHKDQESFTYYEMIDLFVGMKLAGFLNFDDDGNWIVEHRIRWTIIRQYCFIIRLNGKDTEQMRAKYRKMIVDGKYKRYFTQAFFDVVIVERAPIPPSLIPY
jgi:hypothetical protein